MVSLLQSLSKTVHLSLFLALLLFLGLYFGGDGFAFDQYFFSWLFRYLHVLAGIMWIGLLWYLNFVQIPSMPSIPDDQKPAISKVIAPKVLFWFRWAAFATILTGLIVKKTEINKPTTPMELRNINSNDSGLSFLQYLFVIMVPIA